jgi:hypothetical protein
MGTWFWLNIPLGLLFVGLWAGIPLWLTCTCWNDEINEKHRAIAANADRAAVLGQPASAGSSETGAERLPELSAR